MKKFIITFIVSFIIFYLIEYSLYYFLDIDLVCELQPKNMFLYLCTVDPKDELACNIYTGSFLEEGFDYHMKNVWDVEKFDIVIGNPPYNNGTGTGGSRKLWDKFVIYSIENLKKDCYLVFIHPPNWRKPENSILKLFKKYNLKFLNILDEKTGIKYFKCSTKIDYYLLQKSNYNGQTVINNKIQINISNMEFIPNENFDLFKKINGINKIVCPNTSYSSDMKWMKDDDKLKYIYILTKNKDEIKYKYSNELKNFNGIKKVILSLGRYAYPINDFEGKYGMSCYNFGICIDTEEEGINIIKAIESEKFKKLLCENKWGSYNIDWRMFKYFKKDFWKEFI